MQANNHDQLAPTLPRLRSAQPGRVPAPGAVPPLPNDTIPPDPQRQVVILGAGPAGLTAAYELTRYRIPVTVLEADPRYVGGISRTVESQGYRFDIGGHRFFSKSEEVEAFWTEVMGDELLVRPRLSRILYKGKYFDYPLKASNALFGLGIFETIRCLTSYAGARLHPIKDPKNLEDWVSNQFGHRLFSIFFKTYTEKVWGISSKELSADWAAQRIKGLNMIEAIKSALLPQKKKKGGEVIKTLIDQFRYPRLGPGQMWETARDQIQARGQRVFMGQEVVSIRHSGGRVTEVLVRDTTDQVHSLPGAQFISTLPMRNLVEMCDPPLPADVQHAARSLKYRDFLTVAMVLNLPEVFPDNWIYLHDPDIIAGRIQNFKNWSPSMVANPQTTCLGLEYFVFEGDGMWTSSDDDLVKLGGQELVKLGMCQPENILGGAVVRQPKAYPVYDDNYKQHLDVIRIFMQQNLPNLQLVGRNGMHHYNNQDHSMMTALLAARNIALGSHFDPWKVNTDAEYHEEARLEDEDKSGRLMPTRIPASAEK
ncbi:MAG: NAD(P)/FAD-dependent oxidoreductase [Ktedonobacterales bacterium]|nr:NAD(P)/FAD-dependent oxidoreductase [Ktedonobacterales bacterium]